MWAEHDILQSIIKTFLIFQPYTPTENNQWAVTQFDSQINNDPRETDKIVTHCPSSFIGLWYHLGYNG